MEKPDVSARITAYTQQHRGSVLYDAAESILLDVYSGKTLKLDLSRVVDVREEQNHQAGGTYLVIERDDGVQFALSTPGVAFALDPRNAGPIPDGPGAVCMRDLTQVLGRLHHYLFDHPDSAPTRDSLAQVQLAIAIVDGARRIGFDIGDEERALEGLLSEVERRAPKPTAH